VTCHQRVCILAQARSIIDDYLRQLNIKRPKRDQPIESLLACLVERKEIRSDRIENVVALSREQTIASKRARPLQTPLPNLLPYYLRKIRIFHGVTRSSRVQQVNTPFCDSARSDQEKERGQSERIARAIETQRGEGRESIISLRITDSRARIYTALYRQRRTNLDRMYTRPRTVAFASVCSFLEPA